MARKNTKRGKRTSTTNSKARVKINDSSNVFCKTNDSSSDSDDDIEALVNQTLRKVKTKTGLQNMYSANTHNASISAEKSAISEDDESENSDEGTSVNQTISADKTSYKLLSSSLDPGEEYSSTYLNTDVMRKPGKKSDKLVELTVKDSSNTKLLQKSVIPAGVEKQFTMPEYEKSLNQQRKQRKEEREKTKGKGWFGMEAQEMTDDKKNDLMVLHMRRALDPKRFYKAPDMKGLPKYFEMGTVVETAADYYSGRIPKKQRKKTLVDELLADAEFRKYNKRKYTEIQESKMRKTGAYKRMKRLKKKK